ncbi:MAG: phosphate-starvation-inducible PsiE family protein [Actinomycetota bacterium]|nr:phosphate-starvation-inducible PsiE family protein [Actinomycetota bacterium]
MAEKPAIELAARRADPALRPRAGEGLRHEGRRVIGLVEVAEDIVHYAVALLLVAVAAAVLVKSVIDFFGHRDLVFAVRVTGVINSVLFVIIVMEILRTVVAHFDDAGLQLKPFLIIGIISAVRHILTVGAQVSLGGAEGTAADFRRAQTELGVNAAVVMALVLGLVLVWRSERVTATSAETDTTHGLTS